MKPFAIEPIQPTTDHHQESPRQKPTDNKIYDLILFRVQWPRRKEGSLLASATAPYVVIPAIKNDYVRLPLRRKRPILIRRLGAMPSKYCPIGIRRCDPHNWINALMQFLLFVPQLREMFAYTPQSLFSFTTFIDQYFVDVEDKKIITIAESGDLIQSLIGKFPQLFRCRGVANLHEVIQAISESACASTSLTAGFQPEWQILWNPKEDLHMDEVFNRKTVPPELLIALETLYDPLMRKRPNLLFHGSLLKQYFSSRTPAGYELDALIEHRSEEEKGGEYFTYLKINGSWMQCADERIAPLRRSTSLDLPLRRGILFHYRRVAIGFNNSGLV